MIGPPDFPRLTAENHRVTSGSEASSNSRGASSAPG
jgi:hypothetical protein